MTHLNGESNPSRRNVVHCTYPAQHWWQTAIFLGTGRLRIATPTHFFVTPSVMKVLVTGAAGFIGFHTAVKLLARGNDVVGFDNLNAYYDVRLKEARLDLLSPYGTFRFVRGDLADSKLMAEMFRKEGFDSVIHLAAQAGVRYSLKNPHAYVDSNLVGFTNILEGVRHNPVNHLVYASSSSVYGANTEMPFSVHHNVDHPISLYAATKKANELMAHCYSHLYRIPTTGLRFFTVYGPWGRPDMALFLFTKAILNGEAIELFNHGHMRRDFTYIDDIVEGVLRVLDRPATPNPQWDSANPDTATSTAPYRIYNIGNNSPVELGHLVEVLEEALGRVAEKRFVDMQPGDVPATYADIEALSNDVGFKPSTPIEIGVKLFVDWYRQFYSMPEALGREVGGRTA
jgi:UDP-glucuronate 4-epimerase